MKKPFQVGERVRAFWQSDMGPETADGQISEIAEDGTLRITDPKIIRSLIMHPKQCRHLVKRKRREIWVSDYGNENQGWWNYDPKLPNTVRFIEAPKGKSK